MNTNRHTGKMIWKSLLVFLLAVLVFQNSGMSGMAAPGDQPQSSLGGPLSCSTPSYGDVQIVLMIDDSGSMRSNDPNFQRNKDAKKLINTLAIQYYLPALVENSGPRLPVLNVAVIHFGRTVLKPESVQWATLDLNDDPKNTQRNTELTNDWTVQLFDAIDQNREFGYTRELTDFNPAFKKAKELWSSSDVKVAEGDGTLRSVMLFTDGTPEDKGGRYANERLQNYFEDLRLAVDGLPMLDGIYIAGYKINSQYFTQQVFDQWNDKIASKIIILQGKDTADQFNKELKEIQEASSGISRVGDNLELARFARLDIKVDSALNSVPQGVTGDINFTVVDSSGSPVLPGDNPKYELVLTSVSVLQGTQSETLEFRSDGGNYQSSWKPETAENGQFNILASVVDAGKNTVLTCSSNFIVPVKPSSLSASPIKVTLVIGSPSFVDNETVTFPMQLNYEGNQAPATSIDWNASASTTNGSVPASVSPGSATPGTYFLTVKPIGDANEIQAEVNLTLKIDGQDILLHAKPFATRPAPVCNYGDLWNIWFWPLVIGLLGLMILLLVLRAGSRRDNVEDPRANRDIFRIRDWHLLFWPLPVLLILLILVPIMRWSCVIPPWLFLISLLFWLIMTGLLRFIPGQNIPRSRAWVLFVALLVLAFFGILTVTNSILSLLWLVAALLAIGITVWYISPYETLAPPPHDLDDLKELEGIGEKVEEILHAHDIYTFKELAEIEDWHVIEGWLNTATEENKTKGKSTPWGKMMDPKTWPQQAKLADIDKRYRNRADKLNYQAYKAWLKDGIEPDEHNNPEKPRRPMALSWNGIPAFTPIVLDLAVGPTSVQPNKCIVLPVQLNRGADQVNLTAIEWKVSASTLPDGKKVKAVMKMVREDLSTHELVIGPVQDETEEIQVIIQALVNGRSIEIYYGKAISVQVNPPVLPPDNLEDLEGIGPVYRQMLNENNIYTFGELAETDVKVITRWLNEHGHEREDPKTWPQQAKLARIAKYGDEEDKKSYEAYKAWLNRGIEPDERDKDEKDRRTEALVWRGTAELTEKAYPEYFKRK